MNDLIVILILVLLAAAALYSCIRKRGCGSCGGCGGACGSCGKDCCPGRKKPEDKHRPQN